MRARWRELDSRGHRKKEEEEEEEDNNSGRVRSSGHGFWKKHFVGGGIRRHEGPQVAL